MGGGLVLHTVCESLEALSGDERDLAGERQPERWEVEDRPLLLPLWWTFWVVSNILDNAAFRLAFRDDPTLDQLITANGMALVSDFMGIPLAVVFFVVVQKIHRMQMEQAQLQSFS